jgi:hypothetical protein
LQLINFIDEFKSGSKSERNKKIVKRYLGLDGLGGSSMEVAGEPFSLTRESVRQILKKYKRAIDESKMSFLPLKDALNTLDKLAPLSSKTAGQKLTSMGLLEEGFLVEGLLITADFVGLKSTKNEVCSVKSKSFRSQDYTTFIVIKDHLELPQYIYSQALKETSHNGASSVLHLSESIKAQKDSKETRENLVRDIIDSIDGVVWLDESKNWFYFVDQARNRVLSRLHKIFSVFKSATFDSVKEGIRRSINKHNDEISRRLPNHVLEAIIKEEGIASENGILSRNIEAFSSDETIADPDKRKILDFELRILKVLSAHPIATIQEVELENNIVNNKHDKYFFSMALNYSPLIVRIKRGTYRATGTI